VREIMLSTRNSITKPLASLFLLALILTGGSRECCTALALSPNENAASPEKNANPTEKPKPKPDFDRLKLRALPADNQDLTQGVKPGHWMAATLDAKANNFDFTGDLEVGVTTSQGLPVELEHTAYRLFATRAANLPKGQAKRFELLFCVPRSLSTTAATRLYAAHNGPLALEDRQPVSHMPSYQYHLYVLSSQPDRYRFLKTLATVKPPWDALTEKEHENYYRVQLPRVGQTVPLPSNPLAWTSIAVLIWDDIHPKVLRSEQQQAIIDWLHWGGQIIVSGPRSLDLLAGSFLEPYLPATASESREIDRQTLVELSNNWTVPMLKGLGEGLTVSAPWTGVRLVTREGATFVPNTGELLAERRAGRGRVVVSAFRLTERDLVRWRSFDSLLNGALLRRPPRVYTEGPLGAATIDWLGKPKHRLDASLITNLRYTSRDGGSSTERKKLEEQAGLPTDTAEMLATMASNNGSSFDPSKLEVDALSDSMRFAYEAHQPGLAGWNDFSPVAQAARQALREAAGIVVPRRGFVIGVLGVYLTVIVPLNWLVFWALGKVEWAWIAAPVIAVACAVTVVKMARLDIGFARSRTEIAVVETQSEYPRAHVTRYTALYTSLSSSYDLHLSEPTAIAAPFSTDITFRPLTGQAIRPVVFERTNEVKLLEYPVSSNSTGMLHSEQMLDLGGAFAWQDRGNLSPRLTNGTQMSLEGTAVFRRIRDEKGKAATEVAWIGDLRARQDILLWFRPLSEWDEERDRGRALLTSSKPAPGTISLKSLISVTNDLTDANVGDARLIGWTEEEVPGVRIEPRSPQQRFATLVVANLRYDLGPAPQKDVNTIAEVEDPDRGQDELD
jgi:hypothetical protein